MVLFGFVSSSCSVERSGSCGVRDLSCGRLGELDASSFSLILLVLAVLSGGVQIGLVSTDSVGSFSEDFHGL